MQVTIKSKHLDVSPRMRTHIEQKVKRLERLVGQEGLVEVTVTREQTRSAQDRFTVHLVLANLRHFQPIYATTSNVNVKTALDLVLDKVTAQLGRQKGRHVTAHRLPTSAVQTLALSREGHLSGLDQAPFTETELEPAENEEIWSGISEIRSVETVPLSDQEVIARMEDEGLSFYPFINVETGSVNVMYRLPNVGFGLLVPATERETSTRK